MSPNITQQKAEALILMSTNAKEAFTDSMLTLWLDLLEPYTLEAVHNAVKSIIENYPYRGLPPFSEMKKYLVAQESYSPVELNMQAIAEWGILLEKISECGMNNPPKLHKTTSYVLRLLGGWNAACSWLNQDMPFRRREFLEFWVNSHEKVEAMEAGADGVVKALTEKRQKSVGPTQIGALLNSFPVANSKNIAA